MKICINAELFELIADNPKVEQAGVYWNEFNQHYKATFEIKDEDIIEVYFQDNLQKLKNSEG